MKCVSHTFAVRSKRVCGVFADQGWQSANVVKATYDTKPWPYIESRGSQVWEVSGLGDVFDMRLKCVSKAFAVRLKRVCDVFAGTKPSRVLT